MNTPTPWRVECSMSALLQRDQESRAVVPPAASRVELSILLYNTQDYHTHPNATLFCLFSSADATWVAMAVYGHAQ